MHLLFLFCLLMPIFLQISKSISQAFHANFFLNTTNFFVNAQWWCSLLCSCSLRNAVLKEFTQGNAPLLRCPQKKSNLPLNRRNFYVLNALPISKTVTGYLAPWKPDSKIKNTPRWARIIELFWTRRLRCGWWELAESIQEPNFFTEITHKKKTNSMELKT